MSENLSIEDLRFQLGPLVTEHTHYKQWETRFMNGLGEKRDGEDQKGSEERVISPEYRNQLNKWIGDVRKLLSDTEKTIAYYVEQLPIWAEHYASEKGIGCLTIGYLEARVDLDKAMSNGLVVISKVRQYCGYGKRGWDKHTKRPFDAMLKTQLYTTGLSLMQSRNKIGHKYGAFYDNRRTRTGNSEVIVEERVKGGKAKKVTWAEAKPIHQMQDAIRIMLQKVIEDYVLIRAELEGREVRPPYAEEYLGRKHDD